MENNTINQTDFLRRALLKARKEHKCNWCHEVISKGEVYDLMVGKWDGYFYTQRLHIECITAIERTAKDMGLSTYVWQGGKHTRGKCSEDFLGEY